MLSFCFSASAPKLQNQGSRLGLLIDPQAAMCRLGMLSTWQMPAHEHLYLLCSPVTAVGMHDQHLVGFIKIDAGLSVQTTVTCIHLVGKLFDSCICLAVHCITGIATCDAKS